MPWCAVESHPFAESKLTRGIAENGVSSFLPLVLRDVPPRMTRRGVLSRPTEPRFPGYVFAFIDAPGEVAKVLYTAGAKKILGASPATGWRPSPLPKGYVDELMLEQPSTRDGEQLPASLRMYRPGDVVVIVKGKGAVFELIVRKDHGAKIEVWLDSFGARRSAFIKRESVTG